MFLLSSQQANRIPAGQVTPRLVHCVLVGQAYHTPTRQGGHDSGVLDGHVPAGHAEPVP